jgi:hypothetical protein
MLYSKGGHSAAYELHSPCTSQVQLTQDTFNNVQAKIFYLISPHKYKHFFPFCLKSSIFIFVFMLLDSMATLKRHLQKE